MNNKRYIITGGPGSGKSSIIQELERMSYRCYRESSRIIIKQQNIIKGNLTPWNNLTGFAEACYIRMKNELSLSNRMHLSFYDRGIPDIIAYLRFGNIKVPNKYFSEHKNYNNKIFICPPWEDIYINDAERPETFSHSKSMYKHLKREYTLLGCELIELPKISVIERIKFIEQKLNISANT